MADNGDTGMRGNPLVMVNVIGLIVWLLLWAVIALGVLE